MIEVKNFSGKMDLDSSPYRVAPNDYTNALNITKDAIEGSNDRVVTNVVGNRIVSYSYHSGGTPTVIGAYANTVRNTVIVFAFHPTGYHTIFEYNNTTRTTQKLLENLTDTGGVDILGFTLLGKITSVNIYNRDEGDLLYFLDSLGRPTGFNIESMRSGLYTPVTRQIINVIKAPPLSPASTIYGNDTTRRNNNLRKAFFRFAYLWVYDDFEESVISPISALSLPVNILDDTYTSVVTNNNVITVSLNSGAKNVKSVQLLMSYVRGSNDWSPFVIVKTIDKAKESISDDTIFSYSFFNDSTYPTKNEQQVALLFDFVPQFANAQEMPNGNVLNYAAISEGYNNDITPNVVNTVTVYPVTSPSSGSLSVSLAANFGVIFQTMDWQFSGIPAVGTVITVTVKRSSDGAEITATTYTTVAGDTSNSVALNLVANLTAPSIIASVPSTGLLRLLIPHAIYEPIPATGNYSKITITSPTAPTTSNSITTWMWSTERNIGIAYFDQNGRTNGILYNAKISFPAYSKDGSGNIQLPTINTKIYHVPPDWAYSYNFYFTPEGTKYIMWASVDVNISETDYVYFDVTDFIVNSSKYPTTTAVCSYTFQDGDRLKLLEAIGSTSYFADTYDAAILGLVNEPKINGTVQTGKQFIKIKKSVPFADATFTPNLHNYTILLYTPAQPTTADNEPFFEFGSQWAILDPTTNTRRHAGQVTDQSADYSVPAEFNFTQGDSYFRPRTIATVDSGASTGTATFNIQDRNIVDFYISAVNSLQGRANVIDINAKFAKYGATIRFGQSIQANTNINGLNRFYPNDLLDVDASYGEIKQLSIRDRFERVFQQLKVGNIPLFQSIAKSSDGTTINIVTDKLLNPVQYYIGDFGIGNNPESLASYNYADYCTSNIKGVILRVSQDGVEAISIENDINSWATEFLPQRDGINYFMYGAFDQRLNNYILALTASATDTAQTIYFNENPIQQEKGFKSFLSYNPEFMTTLGILLITFKDGQLYTHDSTQYNTFYGVTYDSSITPVFNQNHLEKKTFESIEEIGSQVWDCPTITTNTNSFNNTKQASNLISQDFADLESNFNASFLRDSNIDIINGDILKGNYIVVTFRAQQPIELVTLDVVSLKSIDSPLTVMR